MNLQLKGKTALVTGSTAGIGVAISTALAKEGAEVIVNGRTQVRVDSAVQTSGAAHGLAADLGTEAGTLAATARFPYGLKKLIEHIWKVIGIASTCEDLKELNRKMDELYSKRQGFQYAFKLVSPP